MIDINKTVIGIAAGVASTLFIGYCIYFDNKRRNDPEYKKKVRERRRRNRKTDTPKTTLPDLNDHEAIERYFLQEIKLGENLIARGEFETGVQHLANAIVVCGQPARLLHVLQSSLPAPIFTMLIKKMQEFGTRSATGQSEGLNVSGANLGIPDNTSNLLDSSTAPGIIDDLE